MAAAANRASSARVPRDPRSTPPGRANRRRASLAFCACASQEQNDVRRVAQELGGVQHPVEPVRHTQRADVADHELADQLMLAAKIGVHHAGIMPRYKELVERLTLERLLRFVVSTETISAGINLPAKRVLFPSLRKYVKKKGRLVTPAEYHQMSGRAGRPQFDSPCDRRRITSF